MATCGQLIWAIAIAVALVGCAPAEVEEASAPPPRISIIRHAEKPPAESMSIHLNAVGNERAEALHRLFEQSADRPDPFPKPDFLFAGKNSGSSHRPAETIAPLAKRLHLKINAEYSTDDPAKLARELLGNAKYSGKTVLICWRHSSITQLAGHLKTADAPKNWKDSTFDRVWQIAYDDRGHATLQDRPQKLLPNDSQR